MMLFATLFVVTMLLTGATYLVVNRTLENREVSKVRNRVTGRAGPKKSAEAVAETPLFVPETAKGKDLFSRLLEKLNFDHYLQNLIEQAGCSWPAGQVCLVSLVLALAAFNAVWYWFPWVKAFAFVAGPLAGALPFLVLRRMRTKRIAVFEAQFPDALQFIARAMRAGHAFSVSLELLHKEFADPLGNEFRRTFEEQNLGLPVDITLEKLGKRVPLMDVQFFVAAVLLQKRTGGNLAEILEKLSSLIRERFKLRGQIRTISAHGRLSSLVLTAIPTAVGILMYFVNREHMEFFQKEYAGQLMAGLALGFQALGYFIMRQIVKIEV
jgi:tight adherence protein B